MLRWNPGKERLSFVQHRLHPGFKRPTRGRHNVGGGMVVTKRLSIQSVLIRGIWPRREAALSQFVCRDAVVVRSMTMSCTDTGSSLVMPSSLLWQTFWNVWIFRSSSGFMGQVSLPYSSTVRTAADIWCFVASDASLENQSWFIRWKPDMALVIRFLTSSSAQPALINIEPR